MLLRNKAAIVAAIMIGAPLATASAASAKTVTLPDCVEVAPSPAVTHQVTVVDVPAVPGTEGTPAQTHTEVIVDTPAIPPIDIPAVTHVVVDAEAYDETVIDSPAVDAVAEVWANFSPNHNQGPLLTPPLFPVDPRGTWQLHDHIPPGQAGPDGVYSTSNHGHASWFYRLNAKAAIPAVTHVVHHDAVTHVVVDVPAIHIPGVPAVTHTVVVVDVPAVPGTDGKPAVTHQETVVDSPAVKGKKCPDTLPHTGASAATFGIAGLGLAAIAGGSALMATGRRRKQ
jgi:LPXTG-motif cell wall-anchored protein